jgi:hypothetical protein
MDNYFSEMKEQTRLLGVLIEKVEDMHVAIVKMGCSETNAELMNKKMGEVAKMFSGTPFAGIIEKMMAAGGNHG